MDQLYAGPSPDCVYGSLVRVENELVEEGSASVEEGSGDIFAVVTGECTLTTRATVYGFGLSWWEEQVPCAQFG